MNINIEEVIQILNENVDEVHLTDIIILYSDWDYLCKNYVLSNKFMRKYNEYLNWSYICRTQKLSEEFMDDYSNKLDWDYISIFQELSEKFIEKHINKIKFICVWSKYYHKFSNEFKRKYHVLI